MTCMGNLAFLLDGANLFYEKSDAQAVILNLLGDPKPSSEHKMYTLILEFFRDRWVE